MHSPQSEDNNGDGDSAFFCNVKCINVCMPNTNCGPGWLVKYDDRTFFDDDLICFVTVKSEAEEDELDDPDASVNTILNAFGLGNSSTRVIASTGISLFTAASIALLLLFW